MKINDGVLQLGQLVEHKTFGLGKIVAADSATVQVYFKQKDASTPELRVVRYPLGSPYLARVDGIADVELDNLPPWVGDRFDRPKTPIVLSAAIAKFLTLFPGGLDDPIFLRCEGRYKEAAHERWIVLRPSFDEMIQQQDAKAIANVVDAVYGDSKAPKDSPESRLNVLYQRIEEPAFFDALKAGNAATVAYAAAAIAFIKAPSSSATFDAYRDALLDLPTREGGAQLNHWTTLTWLPFIADPVNHLLIKPTIVRAFASASGFDPLYQPELNYETYSKCIEFGRWLQVTLESSALNLKQRKLDLLDVQSFMWAVQRWTDEDMASASEALHSEPPREN